jgi:hypothetical protein
MKHLILAVLLLAACSKPNITTYETKEIFLLLLFLSLFFCHCAWYLLFYSPHHYVAIFKFFALTDVDANLK